MSLILNDNWRYVTAAGGVAFVGSNTASGSEDACRREDTWVVHIDMVNLTISVASGLRYQEHCRNNSGVQLDC